MSANSDTPYSTMPISRAELRALLQQQQTHPLLTFVHISDTHISDDPAYNLPETSYTPLQGARELVRQINALPFTPDFVLHTGDVAYDPHEAAYHTAREVLSAIRFPVYYLVGNHDDGAALQRMMAGQADPILTYDYQFEKNGVQIVCLDSNRPANFAGGALSRDQLAWLEAITRSDSTSPLVVGVHHNALPIGSPFWDDFMRMSNGEEFHRVLTYAGKRLRGVFFGHVHQSTETYRDGILYSSVPSSWYQLHCWPGQSGIEQDRDAEPGFNVVSITATQTFIRRHRFRVPEHRQQVSANAQTTHGDVA